MALWYRVGSSRLRPAIKLLCTRFSSPASSADLTNAPPVHGSPSIAFIQLRSFAAPPQSKQKVKSSEEGPRINNAITGQVVRLVSDEGHCVVSLREALDRARNLDLDLVEVQRTANPPVCKIMDFNKEKYKKELTERERSKTKSALSKRSGEKKEVRFKAKTEIKDLKVKADGITRLMERGYRVKVTALPSGSQDEDLGEHLSKLLKLIEEVSVIESGPHVDSNKQAYAIVRHTKFGTTKSSKKPSKIAENQTTKPSASESESPAIISPAINNPPQGEESESEWECDTDSDESKLTADQSKSRSKGLVKEEEAVRTEMNRYAKKDENSRGYNSREAAQVPFSNNNNSRDYNGRVGFSNNNNNGYNPPRQFHPGNFGPNIPNRNHVNPNFGQNIPNQNPVNPNFGPNIPNRYPGDPNFSQERNNLPPFQAPNFVPDFPNRNPNFSQERSNLPPFQSPNFRPNVPSRNPNFSPPFQAPKFGPNSPNVNPVNPNFSQQRSNIPPFKPPNFDQFSKEGPINPNFSNQRSNIPPFKSPNFDQFSKEGPINPNFSQQRSSGNELPKPKFGIFNSSSKANESSDQIESNNSKMPKFGIFGSKKTDMPNN